MMLDNDIYNDIDDEEEEMEEEIFDVFLDKLITDFEGIKDYDQFAEYRRKFIEHNVD